MKYNPKVVLAFFESQGLRAPETEFKFCERRWRFDFAWPAHRVYLEVQGGIWLRDSSKKGRGAHSRGARMKKDWEKYNAATCLGWRPLFCEPKDLLTLATVDLIRQAISS